MLRRQRPSPSAVVRAALGGLHRESPGNLNAHRRPDKARLKSDDWASHQRTAAGSAPARRELACFVLPRSVRCIRSLAAQQALDAGKLRSELVRKSFAELIQVVPDLWQLGAHGGVVDFKEFVERARREF